MFNTIILDILFKELSELQISLPICAWIKDFLTKRPQSARLSPQLSSTLTLSAGSPQGFVLSPLLFALYTYDCTPSRPIITIIKFTDDTTVVGLIFNRDETAYWDEVENLSAWCSENNLTLNTKRIEELIIAFSQSRKDLAPLFIIEPMNQGHCEKGIAPAALPTSPKEKQLGKETASTTPRWRVCPHTVCVCSVYYSKGQERPTERDKNHTKIHGCTLPTLDDISTSCCFRRTKAIITDPSHLVHHLLLSG